MREAGHNPGRKGNNMNPKIKAFADAQKAYTVARDNHFAMQAIEKRAQNCILSENNFVIGEEWEEKGERILDSKSDYLMDDSDFSHYVQLVHDRLALSGYNIPLENTATYLTHPALKAAEEAMIDASMPITPIIKPEQVTKIRNHWKYRAELIDMLVKLDVRTIPQAI
jgi:hypothetical protein